VKGYIHDDMSVFIGMPILFIGPSALSMSVLGYSCMANGGDDRILLSQYLQAGACAFGRHEAF